MASEMVAEKQSQSDLVLVVEDDQGLSRLIQKRLARCGYRIDVAMLAADALRKLEDTDYQLLLLDYKLPDFTGKQLVERLPKKVGGVPFIIMTGQGDQKTAVEMMKLGARDYLVKDQTFIDLLPEVVKQTLHRIAVEEKYVVAQQALVESDERLNLALRSAGIGTWCWDLEDNSLLWDDYIHPLFGLTPGTFSGRYEDFLELLDSRDKERVHAELRHAIEEDKEYDSEYRVVWPNTIVRVLAARGKVYREADGQAMRMTGVCWDITDAKLAEEEIRRLNADLEKRVIERTAQLEAANSELEAFSYSVSHDLRAPLRHMQGFVNLLKEHVGETLDAQSRRYVEIITESTQKMGRLIDDLLDFSRTGRVEMHECPVNPNVLIDEIRNELSHDTQGRTIEWKIEELPVAKADRAMLRQVWVNLISNAVKYTRGCDRAKIAIGATSTGHQDVFFVRDNGVGFDMKYVDKLFGVFQRLHRAKEFEGTGIGLANVRRIIHRHGGETWAEGEVQAGATFYFSLPKR